MPNPYLQDQASAISRNLTQNLQENILPSINSGAMMAGGFGGSRQGIAQGLGIGRTQQAIGDAQANLYSQGYNTDQQIGAQRDIASMNDATQRYGLDNQFKINLGSLGLQRDIASMNDATQRYGLDNQFKINLGSLGLQDKSLDYNNANTNRSLDLSQYSLGANLANQGNLGFVNQGQQLYASGQQQQQAPWSTLGQYAGAVSPFTGLNSSTSQTTPGYSALQGALSGGLTMAQIIKLLGG